jgi:hypothetical protein
MIADPTYTDTSCYMLLSDTYVSFSRLQPDYETIGMMTSINQARATRLGTNRARPHVVSNQTDAAETTGPGMTRLSPLTTAAPCSALHQSPEKSLAPLRVSTGKWPRPTYEQQEGHVTTRRGCPPEGRGQDRPPPGAGPARPFVRSPTREAGHACGGGLRLVSIQQPPRAQWHSRY